MMYTSVYGRLGKDAQTIKTSTGNPMAAANLAVDVGGRDKEATLWVRVVAFGKLAELLAEHRKADMLAASGRLELSHWTGEDGTERDSWQLIADSLHSSRTVRPGRKRRSKEQDAAGGGVDSSRTRAPGNGEPPFNDTLEF
jgi:single-stranded DNA-binding protein